ncbi:porin OmpA [soil metagenome]
MPSSKSLDHRKNAMNQKSMLRLLVLGGLAPLAMSSAQAQTQDSEPGYYYGGLSVGQSTSRIDDERITANLATAGLATTSMSLDERDTAFKLFGGYQFNRNWALEAGYFNLGKFGYTSTTSPAGTLHGQIKLQGFNLDVVGTLPLSERFSAIGRVGVQVADARDSFSGTGAVQVLSPNPSKRDTNYKLGIGLQYAFSPSLLVRAEAERYRINDAVGNRGDINMFSVTLIIPFGRMPETAPRSVAVSSYVPPAPAVAAAPVPATTLDAPPPPRRVSFGADSLFGFDQSTLRTEGRTALDKFRLELDATTFETIRVEGHTDRLGTARYNQALSQRRADAVKGYLLGRGGIDAARISATGRGESSPVTKLADCPGTAPTPALIACLQPDRRVEVEVSGIQAGGRPR